MAVRKVAHKRKSVANPKHRKARAKAANPAKRKSTHRRKRKANPAHRKHHASAMRMANPGKARKAHRRKANPAHRKHHARKRNPSMVADRASFASLTKDALMVGAPALLTVAIVDQVGFVKALKTAVKMGADGKTPALDKDGKTQPDTLKNVLGNALPGLVYAGIGGATYALAKKSPKARRWGKLAAMLGGAVAVIDAGREVVGQQVATSVPSLAKLGVPAAAAGTWLPGPQRSQQAGTWLPGPQQQRAAVGALARDVAPPAPASGQMDALAQNLVPAKRVMF